MTSLKTQQARRVQTHRPRRAFATLDSWDEKLDGKLDSSKIVDKVFDGQMKQGFWKTVDREGVYMEDGFVTQTLEEETVEAVDDGPLGKERLTSRRGKIEIIMLASEKAKASGGG